MYSTIELPVQHTQAFNADMLKAIRVTGQIVTVRIDGETYRGKVITVEGDTWSTVLMSADIVAVDTGCTPLPNHEDPAVVYEWETPWGQITRQWAKLSQVSRGVSLAKCAVKA